jgi:holo-[acyl-carrier protein] synthase
MIKGLGNDIIEIDRVKRLVDLYGNRFLDRIFTLREQEYCKKYQEFARHYAGRFAAKEAIVKALGFGFSPGISFLDIEIINGPSGKPEVYFSERINQRFNNPQVDISISHCKNFATAVAIYSE